MRKNKRLTKGRKRFLKKVLEPALGLCKYSLVSNNQPKHTMKATHYGTCQICESVQKADSRTNRLAAHGYTLAYGWQAGTCTGSGQLPLEVSKAFAEAAVESCKAAVAAFISIPCPPRTEGISRWDKCHVISRWQADQQAHTGRQRFIAWTTQRLENWAPRSQQTIEEVEVAQASAKSSRAGIRALSGAVALAKRALVKFGERFESELDQAVNGALYAERRACWDAGVGVWPNAHKLVSITFQTNRVAKFVSLAKQTGNADLIEGAAKLETLGAEYETAKAAYEAAKA